MGHLKYGPTGHLAFNPPTGHLVDSCDSCLPFNSTASITIRVVFSGLTACDANCTTLPPASIDVVVPYVSPAHWDLADGTTGGFATAFCTDGSWEILVGYYDSTTACYFYGEWVNPVVTVSGGKPVFHLTQTPVHNVYVSALSDCNTGSVITVETL